MHFEIVFIIKINSKIFIYLFIGNVFAFDWNGEIFSHIT